MTPESSPHHELPPLAEISPPFSPQPALAVPPETEPQLAVDVLSSSAPTETDSTDRRPISVTNNVTNNNQVNVVENKGLPADALRAATNLPQPTLTDLRGDEVHLERLPGAHLYARDTEGSVVIVSSPYSAVCTLASQAICHALLRDALSGQRCVTTTLDDTTLPRIRDVVSQEQPKLLVVRLDQEHILDSVINQCQVMQSSGVRVVILLTTTATSARPALGSGTTWHLETPEELLAACEAGEDLRQALKASDWPKQPRDLADLLQKYIVIGGSAEIIKHIDDKQEISSERTLQIVNAAADNESDGFVDLALLFLVSHLPGISESELHEVMERLLLGKTVLVVDKAAPQLRAKADETQLGPSMKDIPAIEHWRLKRREILRRNDLAPVASDNGVSHLQFKNPSWADHVASALDTWEVQQWMTILHSRIELVSDLGKRILPPMLLTPGISKEAEVGLIKATANLFVSAPREYNADWLINQIRQVNSVIEFVVADGHLKALAKASGKEQPDVESFFQMIEALSSVFIGGRSVKDTLFGRFAELCWKIMASKQNVVKLFLDKLSSESMAGSRGEHALDIVRRLRKPRATMQASEFDAWDWLRHLLATASTSVREDIVNLLIADAKSSPADAWQTLTAVAAWLPDCATWTTEDMHNTIVHQWALSVLYRSFRRDVDQHFFVEDAEGIPTWPERRSLLMKWLVHPGFGRAMDRQFDIHKNIRPAWWDAAPDRSVLDAELCVAEMLDYWLFHVAADGRERVLDLSHAVKDHCASLPKDTKPAPRPERRAIWLGCRVMTSVWSAAASRITPQNMPVDYIAVRERYKRRRDSAYALAEIFM